MLGRWHLSWRVFGRIGIFASDWKGNVSYLIYPETKVYHRGLLLAEV